jgi:hypothetical protein
VDAANESEPKGDASAIAVSFVLLPGGANKYLTTYVLMVGRNRVKEMVRSLFAGLDAEAESIRRELLEDQPSSTRQ